MKKFVLCAAAFVAAFASCSKPETDVQIPDSEEKVWVEFTTGAMTKVTREDVDDPEIKHKFVWEENDEVTISGETFKALQSGDKVSFGAEVEPSFLNIAAHNAIYPGSAGSSFDSINIEDTYESVPESGFYGIYAVASSETQSLQFKHLTSLVKFQIPAGNEVSTITISADEPLAGNVSVEMNEGTPVVTVLDAQGVNTITLSGEFESGKDYYVPVIAGAKTNLIVRFNGYLSKTWASATLGQGRVVNMGVLPAPVESSMELRGDAPLSWESGKKFYEDIDCVVLKNVSFTASQGFKFVNNGSTWLQGNVDEGKWAVIKENGDNMKISAGNYDIYITKTFKVARIVPAGDPTPEVIKPQPDYMYLLPSDNWLEADAHFTAWLWKDDGNGKLYNFKENEDVLGLYQVKLNGANKMILFRMEPSKQYTDGDASWPGDEQWYKSANINIESNNLYTVINWHAEGSGISEVDTLL